MLYRRVMKRLRWLANHGKAVRVFSNWPQYFATFGRQSDEQVVLRTRSGLKIAVRENVWDVKIVEEQFVYCDYVRHFHPATATKPVVIDVGSYIGDFALFCAHRYNATVYAYEPTAENYRMLVQNIELNGLGNLIVPVNKGVHSGASVIANVQIHGQEVHVSSYMYADDPTATRRTFPCDTLEELIDRHQIAHVDLLKVDCEGGEYDLLPATPRRIFDRIGSLVFEFHHVNGYEEKLARVLAVVRDADFRIEQRHNLIYGIR